MSHCLTVLRLLIPARIFLSTGVVTASGIANNTSPLDASVTTPSVLAMLFDTARRSRLQDDCRLNS